MASGVTTLAEAERLAPALPRGRFQRRPEEEAEAREMYKKVKSFQAVADHFGIAFRTAQAWVIPGFRERRNKELRDQRRLAREARRSKVSKSALRKAGAAMSELYANCERMQDTLAQARREVTTPEASRSLATAEEHYRHMRDEVVRALGVSPNAEAV